MAFRFVHAADIHLDSPLRSLAFRDPSLQELIGNATRKAFGKIVVLCLEEKVDALLLSGDLYDGEHTSMKTALYLAEHIRKLDEAGVKTYIIRGNHDAISRITAELSFPSSVKVFNGQGDKVDVERVSFAQRHAPDSLLAKFRQPVEGAFNIGLLHTSLGGSPDHDPYAPCELADLRNSGFRYWALRHIHKRSTEEGDVTVVMAGIPQGRDIGEAGPGSVTLVTVSDDGTVTLEEHHTSVAEFCPVTVDLTDMTEWREMLDAVHTALGPKQDNLRSHQLVARLRFIGSTTLSWRMRRDLDLLRTEMNHQAAMLGRTSIDKLDVSCEAPGVTPGTALGTDPVEELHQLMGDIAGEDSFQAELAAIADDLRTQLPPDCRASLGKDAETFAAAVSALTRAGIEDVVARLRAPKAAAD